MHVDVFFPIHLIGRFYLDQTVLAVSKSENRSFQDFHSENKGHHDSVFLPLKSE